MHFRPTLLSFLSALCGLLTAAAADAGDRRLPWPQRDRRSGRQGRAGTADRQGRRSVEDAAARPRQLVAHRLGRPPVHPVGGGGRHGTLVDRRQRQLRRSAVEEGGPLAGAHTHPRADPGRRPRRPPTASALTPSSGMQISFLRPPTTSRAASSGCATSAPTRVNTAPASRPSSTTAGSTSPTIREAVHYDRPVGGAGLQRQGRHGRAGQRGASRPLRLLFDAVPPAKGPGAGATDRRQHGRRHELQPRRRHGELGVQRPGRSPRTRCGRWRRRSRRTGW